jgi:hypothetical protein
VRNAKGAAASRGAPGQDRHHVGTPAYLRNGGTLENAARIAAHESTRTTQLYNRTGDEVSLDEIERILI